MKFLYQNFTEQENFYVFAIYDTQRIAFVQLNEHQLFEDLGGDLFSQGSSPNKSFISSQGSRANFGTSQQFMKTKVIYFDEILEGK